MDSKAVECYRLSVDDENSAVRMNSAADVRIGCLVDGGWFLQHVTGLYTNRFCWQKSIATFSSIPMDTIYYYGRPM